MNTPPTNSHAELRIHALSLQSGPMKAANLIRRWNASPAMRYVVVGSWNTIFSAGFLYLLFFVFDNKYYEYELALTFAISTFQSYTTQRLIVWKSISSGTNQLVRFSVSTVCQYFANSILLYVAVHSLKFQPKYSALPILLGLTCAFYFVNKNIVFKSKPH